MKGPYVDWLLIHNAVVENDEGDFGECEGWDVDNSGGEDDLASGILVGLVRLLISWVHTFWKTANISGVTFHMWIPVPPKR